MKNILISIFCLITITLTSHNIFACECAFQGAFLNVAPKAKLVALVKVTKYLTYKTINGKPTPMSMEVEIINIYKGKEKRKTTVVWGDNGILCRPYISQFDKNKYYVIAFYKAIDTSRGLKGTEEKTTDYSISICGDYWLIADIKTKIAKGKVADKQNEIKLTDLREKLNT